MMRLGFCIAAVSALALGASSAGTGQEKKAFEHTPAELKLFELTNLERKKKDVPPLKLNPALSKVARAHSANMARQGKMEHELDEKKSGDRLRAAGYKYATAGENIARTEGEVPLPDLMKAWMESKGHRENILLETYTEIGIGIAGDKSGTLYYTQVFTRPRQQ